MEDNVDLIFRIRNVSRSEKDQIDAAIRQAGMFREAWIKKLIWEKVKIPRSENFFDTLASAMKPETFFVASNKTEVTK